MRTGSKREASMSLSRHMADNTGAQDSDEEMEDDDDSHESPTTSVPGQKSNDRSQWRFNDGHFGGLSNGISRSVSSLAEGRRDGSRQHHLKADFEARQKQSEELDNGRAAELALREVLERIRDTNSKTTERGVFDFDPYQLTFPSLCLKILPSPPTLWSPSPFPTHENWPIGPPGAKQWEALQRTIRDRVAAHERAAQMSSASPASHSTQPSEELGKLQNHLNTAYHHWQGINDRQRQEAWQLEILRMFSAAEDGRKSLQSQLDIAMRQNEQLRRELEDLRRARDDGEPAPLPPLPHMPADTVGKILEDGFDVHHWDYDSLLEKWRNTIKEGRRVTGGMAAQRTLSATPTVKLNNKKLNNRSNFADIREDDTEIATSAVQQPALSSPSFSAPAANLQQVQQQFQPQQTEQEITQTEQPMTIHHPQPQLMHSAFPPAQAGASRPGSPQFHPHLTAGSAIRDQRRHSAQLSPHSMPTQSRRVSVQLEHISPHPTPQPQPFPRPQQAAARPPPLPQEAHMSIMTFNTQPPALQIPQPPISQPVGVPSPFSTTPIAPPPTHMQQWAPVPADQQFQPHQMHQQLSDETHRIQQQAQQMSQELQAQQMHAQQLHQMQSQSLPPTPVAPPGAYPPHIPDHSFQQMGLQVPHSTDRRNSAPMIDVGHHAMMSHQPMDTPASAGGYMGMAMGFGNPGMGMMVNGTHAG